MEGVVTNSPCSNTFIIGIRHGHRLAFNTWFHNMIPTDCTVIYCNIPGPECNGCPLFDFKLFMSWLLCAISNVRFWTFRSYVHILHITHILLKISSVVTVNFVCFFFMLNPCRTCYSMNFRHWNANFIKLTLKELEQHQVKKKKEE